jgi:4-aminobutyrate aminotransferase
VGRAELIDSIEASSISTFGGNPLATAAALANLDYLLAHDLQANAKDVGSFLLEGLRRLQEGCDIIGEVRGKGLMIGVELVQPGTTAPSPKAAGRVLEGARARGVLIGKGGLYGNVLRIAPPLSVSHQQAEEALAVLADAIRAAEADEVEADEDEAAQRAEAGRKGPARRFTASRQPQAPEHPGD